MEIAISGMGRACTMPGTARLCLNWAASLGELAWQSAHLPLATGATWAPEVGSEGLHTGQGEVTPV